MQPENPNNLSPQNDTNVPVESPAQPESPAPNPFAAPQDQFAAPEAAQSPVPAPDSAPAPVFQPVEPALQSQPAMTTPSFAPEPTAPVVAVEPESSVSDLTLYLVVLFSGLSTIASASYLAWTVLNHLLTEPSGFSLFDFSTFNIYILLYLTMFGALNILASLRLEKRVKVQGSVGEALSTVGAIWRALLVVWGVSAVVGILYAPLSASIAGGDSDIGTSIAVDIVSALIAIALIAGFFWRDMLLHRVRPALIPTVVVAALVGLIAAAGAFTTLNPKKAVEQNTMYDYSSSTYDDSEFSY